MKKYVLIPFTNSSAAAASAVPAAPAAPAVPAVATAAATTTTAVPAVSTAAATTTAVPAVPAVPAAAVPAAAVPAAAAAATPKLSSDSILSSIPQNIKYKARAILQHIEDNDENITWNKKGEVIINQNLIPNSHIIDLIKCMLYRYKNVQPEGLHQFRVALRDSNIPQTLVQNGSGIIRKQSSQRKPPPGVPITEKKERWIWHKM